MNYEEFLKRVKDNIQKYLPSEYAMNEPQIVECKKNNGTFYYGVAVCKQNKRIAPVLDLESYYHKYMEGNVFSTVVREIAATYYKNDLETPTVTQDDFSYKNIKSKVFVQLCNAEKNQKELAESPHEIREDLALKYYIRYEYPNNVIGVVPIRNYHLDFWNITQEELKKQAWENMQYFLKPSLQSLNQIASDYFDPAYEEMWHVENVYILSDESMTYGAIHMFNEYVMQSIAEILADDLLILPSSINEVLIMKKSSVEGGKSIAELKRIVEDVNRNFLTPEEFLSDEVYSYEKDTHIISIADTGEQEFGMSMNM